MSYSFQKFAYISSIYMPSCIKYWQCHSILVNFSCLRCCLLTFLKVTFSKKNLSGTLSECLTALIQIRTDVMSILIWVETVCKSYQQMTIVMASKERA